MRRVQGIGLILVGLALAAPNSQAGNDTGSGGNALSLINAYLAPRRYESLDLGQRLALLRSPGFRRFLLSRGAPPPAARPARPPVRFAISPEEMRLRRPFYFTVPPP